MVSSRRCSARLDERALAAVREIAEISEMAVKEWNGQSAEVNMNKESHNSSEREFEGGSHDAPPGAGGLARSTSMGVMPSSMEDAQYHSSAASRQQKRCQHAVHVHEAG